MYKARIIARQGKKFIVQDAEHKLHQCHVRSQAQEAVCGDRVVCEAKSRGQDIITAIEPRTNQLTRIDNFKREKTLAANIDQMLIVVAALPEFSTLLIDKYLACARLNNCAVTLIVNKAELLHEQQININTLAATYTPVVDHFIVASAKLGYGIHALRKVLIEDTNILVGQSGVGKSSLINRLLDSSTIKIGALSESIQQGRHTTTNAYAHPINSPSQAEIKIIDSPGVRSFSPTFARMDQVALGFKEFDEYIGSCKFANCQHLNEPDCAIKTAAAAHKIAASRYASYTTICEELAGA